jgi:hypothetical protein
MENNEQVTHPSNQEFKMTSRRFPTVLHIRMRRTKDDAYKKMIPARHFSSKKFQWLRHVIVRMSNRWEQLVESVNGYARIAGFVVIFLLLPPNPKRSVNNSGKALKGE